MKTDGHIGSLETLFRALGDRTRLRILGLLVSGEVCVCDIHESLKIPQPKTSRHLAYLRRAGLVEARKKGLWVHYRLAPGADKVIDTILAAVAHGLGHVPAVARDRHRLERRTGCCAPLQNILPAAFACCGPRVADVSVGTEDAGGTEGPPAPQPRGAGATEATSTPMSSSSPDPAADGRPRSPDPSSSSDRQLLNGGRSR